MRPRNEDRTRAERGEYADRSDWRYGESRERWNDEGRRTGGRGNDERGYHAYGRAESEGRTWRDEPDDRMRTYGRDQRDEDFGSAAHAQRREAQRREYEEDSGAWYGGRETASRAGRELGGYGPDPRSRAWQDRDEDYGRHIAEHYGEGRGGYDRGDYAQSGYGAGGPRQGGFGRGLSGQGRDYGGRGYRAEEQPPYGVDDAFGQRGYGQGYGIAAMHGVREAGMRGNTLYAGGEDQPRRTGGSYHIAGEPSPIENHRGRGPRNYTRSDARVTEDLCERLSDADDIDASDIEVRVNNGVAMLSGNVPERWMKHRAEDLAEACGGVKDVDNRIRVASGSRSGMQGQRTVGSGAAAATSETTAEASTTGGRATGRH